MDEKISVIIPVYNVSKYLKRCLDSIINNTYKNLEIICIDDGSTDDSAEILHNMAMKDNRISVIQKNNEGTAETRNKGIEKATGEWIAFVDSDDWIHGRFFELLMENSEDADIVACGYKIVGSDIKDYEVNVVKSASKSLDESYKNNEIKKSVCAKLYRKKLIKEIRFPKGIIVGEDTIFNMKIFANNEMLKVNLIDADLYYYYSRNNSIMHSYHPNVWRDMGKYYLVNIESVKRQDLYLNEAVKSFMLWRWEGMFTKEKINIEYKTMMKRCLQYIKKDSRLGIMKKMFFYLAGTHLYIYRWICIVRDKTILDWEKMQKEKYRKLKTIE